MLSWTIEPKFSKIKKVLSTIKGNPTFVSPEKHFTPIMEQIKQEIIDDFGESALFPDKN